MKTSLKLFIITMTYHVHFWPVLTAFVNKHAMPFLVFFASCHFLLQCRCNHAFHTYKNSSSSQNRIFSLKHRGERLCILHLNNKKGRGGLRKSSLQRIKGAQKSLKNGIVLNRENIFPPTLLL